MMKLCAMDYSHHQFASPPLSKNSSCFTRWKHSTSTPLTSDCPAPAALTQPESNDSPARSPIIILRLGQTAPHERIATTSYQSSRFHNAPAFRSRRARLSAHLQ